VSFTMLALVVVLVLFGLLLRDALHRRRYEQRLSETNDKLAGTIRALERQARESDLLTAARDELQLCMNADEAQHSAVRYLAQLLPGTTGGICFINESRQMVEVEATWSGSTTLMDGFAPDACCGLRSGRMRWRRAGQSEVHCTHFTGKLHLSTAGGARRDAGNGLRGMCFVRNRGDGRRQPEGSAADG
jgi:hypothetical protein